MSRRSDMHLQMNPDMKKWFAEIASHYPTDFDLYYLCFVAGIAKRRKEPSAKAKDFVDYYPGDFSSRGRLLVGLLLATELEELGIELTERETVRKNVRGLVASNGINLSKDGAKLMNQYAYGGYLALSEHFTDKPRTIETFVRMYSDFVREAVTARPKKPRSK
jgi:hypothetical protein